MAGGDGDDDEVRVINTGDTATVKAHLDDTLVRVVMDAGWEENYFWYNIKMILLLLATVMYRTFVVCNVILQIISFVVDSNKIAILKPSGSKKGAVGPAGLEALIVRSDFPRFQATYKATLEDGSGRVVGKFSRSIGNFFTAKGEYAEPTFSEAVQTWYSKSIQKLKNKGS